MIGRLRGKIEERDEDSVIIDVGGVGYQVFCPTRILAQISPGDFATLVIETHVREDHIHLYGFTDAFEREWFRLLTTVQGVGVKLALAMLGAYAPAQLANAIAAQDKASLTRISGVGPKLAERLITELKNKVAKFPAGNVVPLKTKGGAAAEPPSVSEDAVSALVHLGYNRMDAFAAVASAAQKTGETKAVEPLIKASLKELAR